MEKQEYLSQSKYADHRNVTKGYIIYPVKGASTRGVPNGFKNVR